MAYARKRKLLSLSRRQSEKVERLHKDYFNIRMSTACQDNVHNKCTQTRSGMNKSKIQMKPSTEAGPTDWRWIHKTCFIPFHSEIAKRWKKCQVVFAGGNPKRYPWRRPMQHVSRPGVGMCVRYAIVSLFTCSFYWIQVNVLNARTLVLPYEFEQLLHPA